MEQSHPNLILEKLSRTLNCSMFSEDFALKLDQLDIWPNQRSKFIYPKLKNLPKVHLENMNQSYLEQECIYLCGHSLGLQPKSTKSYIESVLQQWAQMGVHGHFEGDQPWNSFENSNKPIMAKLVGAKLDEIAIINFLSVNLHLLMVSFYQPNTKRFKILMEDRAFSSDYYAVESQIKFHNLKANDCIISLKPRKHEHCLRTEDIIEFIEKEGDEICLILFPGIQYLTGQLFKIKEITEAAHRKGCFIGFDLAHCVGNVELLLHEWGVDFAVWCTYKYLNSGPGSIGGLFLHEKHFDHKFPRLAGWWGNKLETRFKMSNQFESTIGASGYALSTGPSILHACLSSSLAIFKETCFKELLLKSRCLTSYLEFLLNEKLKLLNSSIFEMITPSDPDQRGSHLSIKFNTNAQSVFEELEKNGIVCDFRHPDVLRFAPVALYNTFHELYCFVYILEISLFKCFPKN